MVQAAAAVLPAITVLLIHLLVLAVAEAVVKWHKAAAAVADLLGPAGHSRKLSTILSIAPDKLSTSISLAMFGLIPP